jgi:two-component system LytT family sensor kinase
MINPKNKSFFNIRLFNKKYLLPGLILLIFMTVMAALNFTRFVTSELAEGEPPRYKFFFVMETTGAYTILILLPFVIWFIRKFPITRQTLLTRIPLHLLASMVFGLSHTMLMYFSRVTIFSIAGWGTYNYGKFIYKIPMEYTHQFFTYSLIYGIVVFIKYLRESQEQKVRASQLEQQLTKARLQALQMQLHPHFLFNTLNMISSTMYDDVKSADKMIASLSDLLRITLDSKGAEEHRLEKELEILSRYIEIMKARFQDKLVFKTEIEESTTEALVPGFILQPLVENAIKYSMKTLKKAEISIASLKENETLKLIIEDNGPGIPGEMESLFKNGVGLSNTVERLEQLYGNNYQFHLQNRDEGGVRVVMEIPFKI